jgi:hypothetical protein
MGSIALSRYHFGSIDLKRLSAMRRKSERVSLKAPHLFVIWVAIADFAGRRVRDACFLRKRENGEFFRAASVAPRSGAAKGTLTRRRLAKSLVQFSRTYGKNGRR